jgi:dihydrofolate reductase
MTSTEEKQDMRNVVLGMQTTLDGYVAATDGKLDWAFAHFDDELGASAIEALSQLDTILLGRENYQEQAAAWPNRQGPMADIMNNLNKVVFSHSLDQLEWANSRLATDTPAAEIARLKQQPGKDIGVGGGARFAQALSQEGLIDRYRLTVHPVGASPAYMQDAAQAAAQALPNATLRILAGQTHEVAPEVLAPVLTEFFTP